MAARSDVPLQNQPGENEFPVSSAMNAKSFARLSSGRQALIQSFGYGGVLAGCVGGIAIKVSYDSLPQTPTESTNLAYFGFTVAGVLIAVALVLFAIAAWLFSRAASAGARDQRRYYRESDLQRLSDEQRAALQLDAWRSLT
ncbi:MAG: hypothetical protein AAF219_07965, partial [Myxococcota bacterium]